MVRETALAAGDLIYPLFVVHGQGVRRPISSMPGICQLSVDQAVAEAQEAASLGIPAVILFGVPAVKDALGSENFSDQGIIQQATRGLKAALPDLVVIVDLCLCEYTDHGHCGVLKDAGAILKDAGAILKDAGAILKDAGAILKDAGAILKDAGAMATSG
jgi:porphobilinogen synthase